MSNELLERVKIPGEIVKLPSAGQFYEPGVLAEEVSNGEVMVFPMSAFEEIYMKNISEIINGTAITKVFKRCIPQILKPEELYGKDVDQLLLMLRKITYGSTTTVTYKHNCKDAKNHKYDINLNVLISATKYIDPTTIGSRYTVVMENGQVVTLQPIKFKDIMDLLSDTTDYEAANDTILKEKLLTSTVKLIKSVDEITDQEKIEQWCRVIHKDWFHKISGAFSSEEEWGFDNHYVTKCLDCDQDISIEIPLNPMTFFLDS